MMPGVCIHSDPLLSLRSVLWTECLRGSTSALTWDLCGGVNSIMARQQTYSLWKLQLTWFLQCWGFSACLESTFGPHQLFKNQTSFYTLLVEVKHKRTTFSVRVFNSGFIHGQEALIVVLEERNVRHWQVSSAWHYVTSERRNNTFFLLQTQSGECKLHSWLNAVHSCDFSPFL